MKRIQVDKDILPLSTFRANASSMIEKVKEDRRPRVITQHGKSSAILLDVSAYEQMIEKIEVLQEINQARHEIKDGEGVEHEEVMKTLKERVANK
jgi:prevent-host-death family protein